MASEVRTTIELSDIVRVEFECPKCHARTTTAIQEQNFLPSRCKSGFCEQLFFAEDSPEFGYLRGLLDFIGRHSKATNHSYILRFETRPLKQAQ
jgi:hypothetical protein